MSRLRLNFCHLNEHKIRYNFNDMVDLTSTCELEPVTTLDYLLHCNLYSSQRLELLNNVCILKSIPKNYRKEKPLNITLYRSEDFNCNINKEILKATIKFLKRSERFNGPLFDHS